jgi:release factor glutamine methyltransferase
MKVDVNFVNLDFLDEEEWKQLGNYDLIVSNPPYIKKSEESALSDNVLKYEPPLALFVPDENALLFYKAIARFSREHLKPGGSIYVEINEVLGESVIEVFTKNGFSDIILKKDMQGKDRMVKANFG